MISFLFRTFFVCLSAYLAKQNIFYSIFCSIFFSFYSLLFSLNLSLFFYFLLFFYFVILLMVQSFFCLYLFLSLSTSFYLSIRRGDQRRTADHVQNSRWYDFKIFDYRGTGSWFQHHRKSKKKKQFVVFDSLRLISGGDLPSNEIIIIYN